MRTKELHGDTHRRQRGSFLVSLLSDLSWSKLALAGFVVVVAAVPLVLASPFWITVGVEAATLAILGFGLNITLGRAGYLDLGPPIYYGIGGYALAIVYANGVPLLAGAVLILGIALVLGASVGFIVLRASGIYLGIVLLAFAESMRAAADRNILGLTGGENGRLITGLPRWLNVNVQPESFYLLALAVLALVFVASAVLYRSMLGWMWTGTKENPVRLASVGVDVRRHGSVAFGFSAGLAAIAGMLHAMSLQIATPEMFGIAVLVQVLLVVILGGPGVLIGPIIGALFVRVVPAFLDTLEHQGFFESLPPLAERAVTSHLFILGLIYVVVVLYVPGGLTSLRARRVKAGVDQ